jgi:hypothetical protein
LGAEACFIASSVSRGGQTRRKNRQAIETLGFDDAQSDALGRRYRISITHGNPRLEKIGHKPRAVPSEEVSCEPAASNSISRPTNFIKRQVTTPIRDGSVSRKGCKLTHNALG